jgi:hypothetical protein
MFDAPRALGTYAGIHPTNSDVHKAFVVLNPPTRGEPPTRSCGPHPKHLAAVRRQIRRRWVDDARQRPFWPVPRAGSDFGKTYGDFNTGSPAFIPPDRAGVAAAVQSEIPVVC